MAKSYNQLKLDPEVEENRVEVFPGQELIVFLRGHKIVISNPADHLAVLQFPAEHSGVVVVTAR